MSREPLFPGTTGHAGLRLAMTALVVFCVLPYAGAVDVRAGPVRLPGAPGGEVTGEPRVISPPRRAKPPAPARPSAGVPATPVTVSPQEKARRKRLFAKAKAGDTEAMRALAKAYLAGALGLKKSAVKAAGWLRRAAQAGDARAAYDLARLLLKGGDGVRRAPRIAAALFKAAAERGHVPSMHWLAHMLEFGIGVPKDLKAARVWYEKAAAKGYGLAHVALGLMALTGRGGARDFEAALDHFSKAAEKGDGWALNNLGAMFEMGWGVPKDREKAAIYYELAKERKNPAGMRNLVRLGMARTTPPNPENGHGTAPGNAEGDGAAATPEDSAGNAEAGMPVSTGKEPKKSVTTPGRFNSPVVNTP